MYLGFLEMLQLSGIFNTILIQEKVPIHRDFFYFCTIKF
jgi:hypothetical protein